METSVSPFAPCWPEGDHVRGQQIIAPPKGAVSSLDDECADRIALVHEAIGPLARERSGHRSANHPNLALTCAFDAQDRVGFDRHADPPVI